MTSPRSRVRTTDERGRPIPSTVTLRAVDEKLFAMGAAQVIDPLGDLYQRVESGIVRLTATHQLPIGDGSEGEGGATGGGGGGGSEARDDFRDTLFFRQLETDADGRATVTIPALGRPHLVARQRQRGDRLAAAPARAS